MDCRSISQCEINNILANSDSALVSVGNCCNTFNRTMCSNAVKINGDYRLTLEGGACPQMMNSLANGESVTVKYAGRNCCGTYCVTVTGEPDNVTVCECNKIRFTLSDFVTQGVMKF